MAWSLAFEGASDATIARWSESIAAAPKAASTWMRIHSWVVERTLPYNLSMRVAIVADSLVPSAGGVVARYRTLLYS